MKVKFINVFFCTLLLVSWQQLLAQDPPPPPGSKPLYLNVFLEGLYNPATGLMNKAQDHDGNNPFDRYYGEIADRITVEIHDAGNYNNILYTVNNVNLLRNGQAVAYFPQTYSGAYYVTVKHRNHIETVSATPVSFAGTSASWNFTNAANKAYGSNQKQLASGVFGIYMGDVNQDGFVNGSDRSIVNTSILTIETGYRIQDVNGDGYVNGTDRSLVNTSALSIIQRITP